MLSLKMQKMGLQLAAVLFVILNVNLRAEGVGSAALMWATQFGNKRNCDGKAIAIDEMGNAYVTGMYGNKTHQSIGTHGWYSSGGDVFLTKVDPTGKVLWQKFAGGDGIDGGDAVATFGNDTIYVAGAFTKTIHFGKTKLTAAKSKETSGYSFPDGFVARFDGNGNLIWVRQFGGPAIDHAYGVAADKRGNVYVTGYFQGKVAFGALKLESKSQPRRDLDPDEHDWDYGDMFVAKYDPQGNLLWVRQAGESQLNVAYEIAGDPTGNVYISGVSGNGQIEFGKITVGDGREWWAQRCFLAKYDADGNVLWAQPVAGEHYYQRYDRIAVDGASNLFVGGQFSLTQHVATVTLDASLGSVFVAKYRPNGALAWCKQGGSKIQDTCDALIVDADGQCVIAGGFAESATFGATKIRATPRSAGVSAYDSFMARYNTDGAVVLAQTIHPFRGMAVGTNGSIWLMGGVGNSEIFGTNALKTKTDFWGESVSDTFVARYQLTRP